MPVAYSWALWRGDKYMTRGWWDVVIALCVTLCVSKASSEWLQWIDSWDAEWCRLVAAAAAADDDVVYSLARHTAGGVNYRRLPQHVAAGTVLSGTWKVVPLTSVFLSHHLSYFVVISWCFVALSEIHNRAFNLWCYFLKYRKRYLKVWRSPLKVITTTVNITWALRTWRE